MEKTTATRRRNYRDARMDAETDGGFDVIREQVLGRVSFGAGDHTTTESAFLLIAREPEEGTYRFPAQDGSACVVTIHYEGRRPDGDN